MWVYCSDRNQLHSSQMKYKFRFGILSYLSNTCENPDTGKTKTGFKLEFFILHLMLYSLQGSPDVRFFSKPLCMQKLAKFSLEAFCSVVSIYNPFAVMELECGIEAFLRSFKECCTDMRVVRHYAPLKI